MVDLVSNFHSELKEMMIIVITIAILVVILAIIMAVFLSDFHRPGTALTGLCRLCHFLLVNPVHGLVI